MGKPLDVVNRYYAAWRRGDGLEDVLCPNLLFEGPRAQFRSAREFVSHAPDYGAAMGDMEIVRQFECGDHASCVYELPADAAAEPTARAEVFRVQGDRITEIRLYY